MDDAFVRIPEGWFQMGSEDGPDDERPPHRVWVDAFALAAYPVTRQAYEAFLEATGHEQPRDWQLYGSSPDLPVVGVSWFDCQAYCHWRAAMGTPVRLPTEAEWERAARGDLDGRRYPWGDVIPGWIPDGGRGPVAGPWPVSLGEPNAFGLFGIAANVHEWCSDWYAADFYATSPARNPAGPDHGTRRASRGGSWRHAVTISRCAARSRIDPSFRYADYGFRLARPLTPPAGGQRATDGVVTVNL
jgi:formylglycine-generating enzyme required for sulfatase activity